MDRSPGPVSADLSLIETLGYRPEAEHRLPRLALHRTRMAASARDLGLAFSAEAFDGEIARLATGEAALRLRLELFADGRLQAEAAPFAPLAPDAVWRLALAETRLSSRDPLLRHKTSRRAAYSAARAEIPASTADEVLLLNERGELCEGTITSLFVAAEDGTLLTPPLSAGCLSGVLRTSLICAKKARPARLLPGDLVGRQIYVGNSLRGLIPARL